MTSPDDPTVPAFAPFEAGLFPVEVLVVWGAEGGWHPVTVLYRDGDCPVEFLPPWTAPFSGAVSEDAYASWAYLAERTREGRGGNVYSYELEGFEVATIDDVRRVVHARAVEVIAATHGPFGEVAGTAIMDHPSGPVHLIIPFVVLSDDRWPASLVATAALDTDDVDVRADDGAKVAPVPYQSVENSQRSGSASWPIVPNVAHHLGWNGNLVRFVVHDDATIEEISVVGGPHATPPKELNFGALSATAFTLLEDAPMDEPRSLVIERVPPPRWVTAHHHGQDDALYDVLGEQAEWGFALPWLYRALASPLTHEPLLEAPKVGDNFWPGALAYWSSLLHLLIYGFGWARPDRGLRWWYDAGKPVDDDLRLKLISQVWDADGQLDWFAAWLWSTPWVTEYQLLSELTGYHHDSIPVAIDERWIETMRSEAATSTVPNPIAGGSDPLHLSGHIEGPLHRVSGQTLLLRTSRADRRAILLLDSMVGWYRALSTEAAMLPELSGRSWHVDVVVGPVGWLGTYRRSRTTGLWFGGRHRIHAHGV